MKAVILVLFMVGANPAFSAMPIQNLVPQNSKIEFEATGRPSMMKVRGKAAEATGSLFIKNGIAQGSMTVDLSGLDTGISLRNEHMKEKYLEVQKFPKAILTLKPIQLPTGWQLGKPIESSFNGTLNLHGVEKDIEGKFKVTANSEIQAHFEIKLSDFKIDIPSYLGVTIADTVKVSTQFLAQVE
jgi:polyisoprenoid-binding protein YceI